jgi:hypothetical protein
VPLDTYGDFLSSTFQIMVFNIPEKLKVTLFPEKI